MSMPARYGRTERLMRVVKLMNDVLAAVPAYLLGAFPSAYIFTRLFSGLDIRKEGSGNVGGMNTIRTAGKLPGVLTIIMDIGKGVLAVYLAARLGSPALPLLAAFLAVLGHNYNPFLGFKGGKGLGTTLGVLLILSPFTIVYLIILIAVPALLLRDTNTGAGIGVAALPFVFWFQYQDRLWVLAGAAMALVIILKHAKDFKAYREGRRKLF